MQEEGYIAKILLPAGTKDVEIGQLVAILVDDQGAVGGFKDYKPEGGDQ